MVTQRLYKQQGERHRYPSYRPALDHSSAPPHTFPPCGRWRDGARQPYLPSCRRNHLSSSPTSHPTTIVFLISAPSITKSPASSSGTSPSRYPFVMPNRRGATMDVAGLCRHSDVQEFVPGQDFDYKQAAADDKIQCSNVYRHLSVIYSILSSSSIKT